MSEYPYVHDPEYRRIVERAIADESAGLRPYSTPPFEPLEPEVERAHEQHA